MGFMPPDEVEQMILNAGIDKEKKDALLGALQEVRDYRDTN